MNRTIDRLKLIFLGVFALGSAAVFVYHAFWVWPGDRCEAEQKWWDPQTRVCAKPILISDITGRTIEDKQEEAAIARREAEKAAAAAKAAQPAPAR